METGIAALEALGRSTVDLVLMDLHMPGLDGIETMKRLRLLADPQRAAVPVVVLTADLAAAEDPRLGALGLAGVVTKPVRRAALDAALRAATERAGERTRRTNAARGDAAGRPRLCRGTGGAARRAGHGAALPAVPELGRASIAELVAAAESGDFRAAALLAHRLASSAATLGLGELQLRAEAVERAAAAEDDAVKPLAATVAILFDRAYVALAELVRSARPSGRAADHRVEPIAGAGHGADRTGAPDRQLQLAP